MQQAVFKRKTFERKGNIIFRNAGNGAANEMLEMKLFQVTLPFPYALRDNSESQRDDFSDR